jgi:hypothetical protein
MQSDLQKYESRAPGISARRKYELQASSQQFFMAFEMFYPLVLLCFTQAMILVLLRVSDHASHSYYNNARDFEDDGHRTFDCRDCVGQYALYNAVRLMRRFSILLCALNIIVRVVLVGFRGEIARKLYEVAAACDANGEDTVESRAIFNQQLQRAMSMTDICLSVALVLEAATLVLIACGFCLFFPAIIVMFRRIQAMLDALLQQMALRSDLGTVLLPFEFADYESDGSPTQLEMPIIEARAFLRRIKLAAAAQSRRFLLCLIIILVFTIVLSSDAVFFASIVGSSNTCSEICGACESAFIIMKQWYINTPEIFPVVSSFAMTFPMVLSLWLMTTTQDRELLISPGTRTADSLEHHSVESVSHAKMTKERVRMGIHLS